MASNGSILTKDPNANTLTNGTKTSYGSCSDHTDIDRSSVENDDIGYVEFGSKNGRTCPTCHGMGRIGKEQEDELVALIPFNDHRLKPSRTKCYVVFAILFCLLTCGLILFFLLPRGVSIEFDKFLNYSVLLDKNMSATTITIVSRFNISNSNYFSVDVSDINVEAFFDEVSVGSGGFTAKEMMVGARQSYFPINITVVTYFNSDNNLDFVQNLCTDDKRKVHNLLMVLQTTQTVWYLQHKEQDSITTYEFLDCNKHLVIAT